MNYLHSFRTKVRLKSLKKLFKSSDICNVIMPSQDTKALESDLYQKIDKARFIILSGFACLIEKSHERKNNLQNSFTTKVGKHIPSGFFNVYNIIN